MQKKKNHFGFFFKSTLSVLRCTWTGQIILAENRQMLVLSRVSKGRDVPGQSGTGRPVVPLSRDKKVSFSCCPFVPGQKKFPCPAVPFSRDKSSSKNPGTSSSVPGRPAGQKYHRF
jgi:hypothetical protein